MWRKGEIRVDIQRTITGHYPLEKIKKAIGLMKDALGEKFMTEFVAFRADVCAQKDRQGSRGKTLQRYKKVRGF